MRYYLDCEFDGHNGPLLSMALVEEQGRSLYVRTSARADDPWVIANVEPHMESHQADSSGLNVPSAGVGGWLRRFIADDAAPVIVADSPVDIGRFCRAISTGEDGGWASADYPLMTFEVHNVDCYPTSLPGAVQHNAWWDAMALRHLLATQDDDCCFACLIPFKAGDMVLDDASGGALHAACCGPERESYTNAEGGPLGPNDPIPAGYAWQP